jgi:hypothetical protein
VTLPEPLVRPDADERPARFVSPGLEAAIEQFASPQFLSAGQVNIIALDEVVERFGKRWAARRDQVHAHVDANLERNLGGRGYHLRTSDTDVLICHPEMNRHAAQAACLRYLREILSHFLGESDPSGLTVHEVLSVSPQGLEVRAVDMTRPEPTAASQPAPRAAAGPAGPAAAPARRATHQWTPFVSTSGRRIQVACELQPVVELRSLRRIGFRIVRTATFIDECQDLTLDDYAVLQQRDIVRIDLATISAGISVFKEESGVQEEASLILPLAVQSLFNIDGRAQVITAFKEARALVTRGIICQLSNIDGVPSSTLVATSSLIRPFSLLVVGQVSDDTPARLAGFQGAGLHGLAIECPGTLADAEFAAWASPVVAAAKRAAKSLLMYGVASAAQAALAATLGATHCAIRDA